VRRFVLKYGRLQQKLRLVPRKLTHFPASLPAFFVLRMISAQTRSAFVARENRFTLFRIMR
jgi:hypothetical protein